MENKILMLPADSLADINDVNIDKELSKKERIKEFIKQIKDPYRYKCGDFVIESRYSANGLTYEDRLQIIFQNIS